MKGSPDRNSIDSLRFLLRLGVGTMADALRGAADGSEQPETFSAAIASFEGFERRLIEMDDERRSVAAELQDVLAIGNDAGEAISSLGEAIGFNPRQLCAVRDRSAPAAIFRAMARRVLEDLAAGLANPLDGRPSLPSEVAALEGTNAALTELRCRDIGPVKVFARLWRVSELLARVARPGWAKGLIVTELWLRAIDARRHSSTQ
jgi:hypothetical protein